MNDSEEEHLLMIWDMNVCPNCNKSFPEGRRIGDGKKLRGGFCSLNCYGEYYKLELLEKARLFVKIAKIINHN